MRFRVGERVRTRVANPAGHTRLPQYARGRAGVVDAVIAALPLPDEVVAERRAVPRPVYSVRFLPTELWGDDADRRSVVYLDLYEDYLEPISLEPSAMKG